MQHISSVTQASFKNILFLGDLSPGADTALAYSQALARKFDARLFPAHVRHDAFSSATGFGYAAETTAGPEGNKRRELARLVEYDGVGFKASVRRCEFHYAVPHWIAEYGIDLIVAGTCGRRGVQGSLLGSTAELAVQSALCPVLTIGPRVNVRRLFKFAFDRILLPAELGPRSGAALPYALALAGERDARLTLLHVLPEDSWQYRDRTGILCFAMNELKKLLPEQASTICRPEFAVDAGEAGEQIVRFARNEQADLIVMGLPPVPESTVQMRAGLTYRVISLATCPVLTIRDAEGTNS